MPLNFLRREPRPVSRVTLFPGAYNPPTVAHLALAEAALAWADEVIWVLPAVFPHKAFEHTALPDRAAMLCALAENSGEAGKRFSVATSSGGLFADIAAEARDYFGREADLAVLCGRDAAHRVANWTPDPESFKRMLSLGRLLVADRNGNYLPDEEHRDRVITLPLPANFDEVSSTEVRARLSHADDWRALVPPCIHAEVQRLYVDCQPPPSAR